MKRSLPSHDHLGPAPDSPEDMARLYNSVVAAMALTFDQLKESPEETLARERDELALRIDENPALGETLRGVADHFGLHHQCGDASCTRARRCAGRHAPCVIPEFRKMELQFKPRPIDVASLPKERLPPP